MTPVATRNARAAVEDAFDSKTQEALGQRYLELVYANWAEMVRSLRRTVFLFVLTVIGFLLLDHSKSGELSIGLLKTSNITAILMLLPAATSFFLFEAIDLTIANFYYQDVTGNLMRILYPRIYQNSLELLLAPPTSFAWGVGTVETITPTQPGKIGAARERMADAVVFGLVLGAVGFLIYAYAQLYESDHANSIVVSLSLAFAVFNLARAGFQVGVSWQALGGRE